MGDMPVELRNGHGHRGPEGGEPGGDQGPV